MISIYANNVISALQQIRWPWTFHGHVVELAGKINMKLFIQITDPAIAKMVKMQFCIMPS